MPNYLLQYRMMLWAAKQGCKLYDMRGISGNFSPQSPLYGLYRFKKGFNGTLDELAGEFDYVYKPVKAKLVDKAIDLNEALRGLKRRLSPSRS